MTRYRRTSRQAVVGAALAAIAVATGAVWGLDVIIRRGGLMMPLAPSTGEAAAVDDAAIDPDHMFPDSALLKTEPDMERLIRRAQEFTDNQKYDVAAALWQEVLDRASSELTTRGEWDYRPEQYPLETEEQWKRRWLQTYRSVRADVESLLAKMPPEGLAAYRTVADVKARSLLATAAGLKEEQVLAEVARRFFLSSVGDDAAYRLGCLMLDRYDFLGAGRLFERLIEAYPDPNVSRDEILLRAALCHARTADHPRAEQALKKLRQLVAQRQAVVPAEYVSLVESELKHTSEMVARRTIPAKDWLMALGSPARDGHMQPPTADAMDKLLSESWVHKSDVFDSSEFRRQLGEAAERNPGPQYVYSPYGRQQVRYEATTSRDRLVQQWKANNLTPTAQALFKDGKVFVRTYTHVYCFGTDAVGEPKLLWRAPPEKTSIELSIFGLPKKRKAQSEDFERLAREYSQWNSFMSMAGQFMGQSELMDYRAAVQFGDRTLQSMSAAGDSIYFVDGAPRVKNDLDTAMAAWWGRMPEMPNQQSKSTLVAVSATSGKMLWEWTGKPSAAKPAAKVAMAEKKVVGMAPGEVAQEVNTNEFRILAAPTPHRDLLILPVRVAGTLWLYALRPKEEKNSKGEARQVVEEAWKTSLCDDPQSGVNHWAPVGVCIDGGEIYVASGRGVIFTLDADSGVVRWAVRYHRSLLAGPPKSNPWGGQMVSKPIIKGWEENYVMTHGATLVVMPADCQQILALKRSTGEFVWNSDTNDELTYCMGLVGDSLYVAGPKAVRCFSISARQGSRVWDVAFDSGDVSHGRGVLTGDGVYVPVKDAIHKYSLQAREEGKQLLGKVHVSFTMDREDPVGNLFTDGKSFFALGPERVFALANRELQLKLIDQQIASGETQLKARRLLLRGRGGDLVGAVADLRDVYADVAKKEGAASALEGMLDHFDNLELVKQQPAVALDLLVGANGAITAVPEAQRAQLDPNERLRAAAVLSAAIDAVGQAKTAAATPLLLRAIVAWPDEPMQQAIETALKSVVTAEQADQLRQAIRGGHQATRIVAVHVLGAVLGEKASDELAPLLADGNVALSTAAATALAESGDRRALATLVKLLEHDDATVRQRGIRVLQASTGTRHGFRAFAEPAERNTAVEKWQSWLGGDGKTVKLNVPLKYITNEFGLTLVSDRDGVVREFDSQGNLTWTSKPLVDPWGVQGLPNGHRLVACHQGYYVVEFDHQGNEVWRSPGTLPFCPTAVQRLDNGNTLVAGFKLGDNNAGWIVELGRDGKMIEGREINVPFRIYDLRRLDNGRLLATGTFHNVVVEIDASGKVLEATKLPDLNQPQTARRLPNGHTLVCDNGVPRELRRGRDGVVRRISGMGRVLEYDQRMKVVWSIDKGLGDVLDAERLDNGLTLILETEPEVGNRNVRRTSTLRAIDANGKTAWQRDFASKGLRRVSSY